MGLEAVRGHLRFPDGIYGCSVGSILAAAVAFNLSASQIRTMFDSFFDLDKILPPFRLTSFMDLSTSKGLVSMDLLETTLLNAFQSQSIDLRGKTIKDAPQPLYIVASNMTTQTTTIFSGQVPILEAIKCSSCLPLVFPPQILYNQVYLDGGVLMDSLGSVVPPECLVLHISSPSERLFPKDIADIPLTTYLHRVYRGMRNRPVTRNTLWLHNDSIGILQEITQAEKDLLVEEGLSQTRAFLAKRLPKEGQKSSGGPLSLVGPKQ